MNTTRFAKVIGAIFVLAGVMGFIPAFVSRADFEMEVVLNMGYGYLLGLFPVNVLHNIVHTAIGAWGWVASRSMASSRVFARTLAVVYGALAVMGLIPGLNTVFGFVPLFGHDIWLHAATATLAAYFGFGSYQGVAVEAERERHVA